MNEDSDLEKAVKQRNKTLFCDCLTAVLKPINKTSVGSCTNAGFCVSYRDGAFIHIVRNRCLEIHSSSFRAFEAWGDIFTHN